MPDTNDIPATLSFDIRTKSVDQVPSLGKVGLAKEGSHVGSKAACI